MEEKFKRRLSVWLMHDKKMHHGVTEHWSVCRWFIFFFCIKSIQLVGFASELYYNYIYNL